MEFRSDVNRISLNNGWLRDKRCSSRGIQLEAKDHNRRYCRSCFYYLISARRLCGMQGLIVLLSIIGYREYLQMNGYHEL